jgi:hypothetical protein
VSYQTLHIPKKLGLAVALGCAAAGCASDNATIPQSVSQDLTQNLDALNQGVSNHSCSDAQAKSLPRLEQEVRTLPQNVNPQVRQTLTDGTAHLQQLVAANCRPPATTPTTERSSPSTTTRTGDTEPKRKHKPPPKDQGPPQGDTSPQQPGGGVTIPTPGGPIGIGPNDSSPPTSGGDGG